MITKVTGKMKKYEFAKPGKNPRLIADLTVVGSLLGGYVTKLIKRAQTSISFSSKLHTEFVAAPSFDKLTEAFTRLWSPGHNCFYYFSDDSCLGVDTAEGRLVANMDISSCDTSHTEALFNSMIRCMPPGAVQQLLQRNVAQLSLPFHLRFTDGVARTILRPKLPTLFSGSTMTTCSNNHASLLMALAISQIDFSRLTLDQARREILEACRRAGYIVTLDVCTELQQLQFLKHSPNARYQPWLNFGTILRTLGQCRADVPGASRRTLAERSKVFMSDVIAGMSHAGVSELYRVLAAKYNTPTGRPYVDVDDSYKPYLTFTDSADVSEEDVMLRYGHPVLGFYEALSDAAFGSILRHPFADAIYARDYGYAEPTRQAFLDALPCG